MARSGQKTAKKKTVRRSAKAVRKTAARIASATTTASTQRVLNCIPSRETENDWGFENALTAGIAQAAPPPPKRDLREGWWDIGDQGATGSCVGWATADSVLRWHFVKAGRLQKNEYLSPRFTWMASKEIDEFTNEPTTFIESAGTSLKSALDVARKYGTVRDPVLPFGSGQLYQGTSESFYAIASLLKIANYINLGRDPTRWRQWLASNGPILTRLNVDRTWDLAKQNNGALDIYDMASARGGHAVALVGYDPNMFIVRNSWGVDAWGAKGFGFASNQYAAAAFTEAYGVTVV
jgi:hypothetical protein